MGLVLSDLFYAPFQFGQKTVLYFLVCCWMYFSVLVSPEDRIGNEVIKYTQGFIETLQTLELSVWVL